MSLTQAETDRLAVLPVPVGRLLIDGALRESRAEPLEVVSPINGLHLTDPTPNVGLSGGSVFRLSLKVTGW